MATNPHTAAPLVLEFLKKNTFFGALADDVLTALVQRGHIKTFTKGQTIYQRGDPGDSLMVILSGRVKVVNVAANAREVVLNFLGVGDVNGEIAALDAHDRSATAIALEDTEAFVVYRRDLLPVLDGNPGAVFEIVLVLCEKVRIASAIIEALALQLTGRAAFGLLRLAQQHGRVTKRGILIDLTLSQRDLGSYLGMSRENVNRQLGKLKDARVIHIDDTQIYIVDEQALAELAGAET